MSPPESSGREFRFPIPLDPLRLLLGIRSQWWAFILFPGILFFLGFFAGKNLAEDRFSISLQLLKSRVPSGIQTVTEGEAYKPRELSDDTLLATTYATEVLQRAGRRLDPPLTANEVKSNVEIEKQRRTDFFYLTAHSRASPQDALNLVQAWAREIMSFTQDLQKREALAMVSFLNSQISELNRQVDQINRQILAFAEEEQFFDDQLQVASSLEAVENLRSQLEMARIDLQAKQVQVARYRSEIRSQSPLVDELKAKREELTFLRGRYTDENPLVKEKLYEIEYLERELQATREEGSEDLEAFTGSELGNQLYLEILALESEMTQRAQQVEQLERLVQEREAELVNLPKKQMRLVELKGRRDQLLEAIALMTGRLKEAEFYVNNAPGYWSVFQEPSLNDVVESSRSSKTTLLAAAGLFGGFFLAFVFATGWEIFQPGLRSPLQAGIAFSTIPRLLFQIGESRERSLLPHARFGKDREKHNRDEIMEFWLTEVRASEPPYSRILFAVADTPEDEEAFWDAFFTTIGNRHKPIVFVDFDGSGKIDRPWTSGGVPLPEYERGAEAPVSLLRVQPEDWDKPDLLKGMENHSIVFARFEGIPDPAQFPILKSFHHYFFITHLGFGQHASCAYTANLFRRILGPAQGLLILDRPWKRFFPRLVAWAESKYFKTVFERRTHPASSEDPNS